jgi:dihydrolipoamide dehydrogenase
MDSFAWSRAPTTIAARQSGLGRRHRRVVAAFSIALEMRARFGDIAEIIHAHPTQSEALHEAALKLLGHAIHI